MQKLDTFFFHFPFRIRFRGSHSIDGIPLTELGVGIPPPAPAWGAMVASGREYIGDAWWVSAIPGMAIFLVVMAGNFLGGWMRDRWDPNLRQLD